jgi:large subunit ribosomal protein L1
MAHGKKYREALKKVDRTKQYTFKEAADLVKEVAFAKFDETVEISLNLALKKSQTVRDTVVLPHQFSAEKRVLVFAKGEKAQEALDAGATYVGDDDLVEKIRGGWLDFDVAVATPDMMKDVGRLGPILGRRGLMPNPKTQTVTFDIKGALAELKQGRVEFRSDKTGVVHLAIGKVSMESDKLVENAQAVLNEVLRKKPSDAKGDFLKSIALSSTMAAGATIGSNHNTRSNDGEMHAKRGFWPALSSSIKFNSRFASFTLVTKGYYPNELDISLPFAMVGYAEDIKRVTIMPAYWWLYNRYALERNSHKFLSRDKRKIISQKIETNYIAPDTIEEIFKAMEKLAFWVGKAALEAALIAPSIAANTEAIKEQGHLLLETHPDQVEALKVYAPNLERSETDAVVQKAAQGYRAYSEMLLYGSVSIILNYLDKYESDFFTFQKEALSFIQAHPLNKVAVSGPFINLGGLPVSEPLILHLITQVQENKINSWDEIHRQYDIWWQQYDKVKAIVALQTLQKKAKVVKLEKEHWTYLIEKFIFLCDQNALEVYKTRKKDFEDPFRKMVYRNIREMEEVLGKPEENEFVLTIKNEMNNLKSLARRFAP